MRTQAVMWSPTPSNGCPQISRRIESFRLRSPGVRLPSLPNELSGKPRSGALHSNNPCCGIIGLTIKPLPQQSYRPLHSSPQHASLRRITQGAEPSAGCGTRMVRPSGTRTGRRRKFTGEAHSAIRATSIIVSRTSHNERQPRSKHSRNSPVPQQRSDRSPPPH